jgi:alanine racemase
MTRAARAVIHQGAIKHNLSRVRESAPDSRVIAIIKANGYGHGMLRMAMALQDADAFGVHCMEEAYELREAGHEQPILVLTGFSNHAELKLATRLNTDMVLHHESQLSLLEQYKLPTPVTIWLKVDTGMHRLGFQPDQVTQVMQRIQACDNVTDIHLMTHLACADDRENDMTRLQVNLFNNTVQSLAGERTIANSGGILGWPESHADWVRPGIMLYGVSPFTDSMAMDEGLQPVMTLKTQLIAVNRYNKGDTIGYGANWTCPEDMSVGVAAVGYGDGYPRHAQPGTPVLVNGKKAALIGRVSMDMITLDLRPCSDARVGDEVVLWGQGLPVEMIAEHASTISYELLCGITPRVHVVEEN